jgi:membrane-associated protease RseP (regulator of RpoE activity)
MAVCLSQAVSPEDGYIGVQTKISTDRQYLKITYCWQGSPADIAGLKVGDRIYRIDDKKVDELTDPVSHIRGASGTWVKLTISRFGQTDFFDVNVPRISVPFTDNSYVSEGTLTALIHTNDLTEYGRMDQSSMALLHDDSRDMYQYKTYDIELTSAEDPLLEKELFKELGSQLYGRGMKRSGENPDLIILMKFYTGQKEQYTPPQQIVSTRIKNVYNWYWGVVPVPLTETTTKEGYTDVTYLTTISLKFLDANEIEGSKLPPVVWSGSISTTSKTKQILLDDCDDYFALMLNQFPEVWNQYSEHYYLKHYSYTGLWFNKNDLQNISEVIPGSPAGKIGIQKGDKILSVNGYKLPFKYSDAGAKKWNTMAYEGARSGFRYLFMFSKLVFKPYKTDATNLVFKIERNGKKMTFEIKPEDRFVFLLSKK